jgi:hypothetical protein
MRPVVAKMSSRPPVCAVARLLLMRPAPLVMKPPLRFLSAMPLLPRPPVVARMSVGCRAVLCNEASSSFAQACTMPGREAMSGDSTKPAA